MPVPKRTNLTPIGRINFSLRAYLAGGGATAALIAAAVLVFAALGAYVAFEGLPVGGDDDAAGEVAVNQSERGPAGAATSGDRPGGPGPGGAGSAGRRDAAGGLASDPSEVTTAGSSGASSPLVESSSSPVGGIGQVEPSTQANPATASAGDDGRSIGGTVGEGDGTADQVAQLPLDELTDDVTGPLDEALDEVFELGEGRDSR